MFLKELEYMKKVLIFTFIAIIGIVMCVAEQVNADGARGLVVTPKRIVFEKEDRILEVILSNRGDKEETYRISMVNKAMLEDGQLILTDKPAEGEFFASDVVRYSPRKIVLAPKASQKVRLMSRMKADSKDGEYRSHLLIQQEPQVVTPPSAKDNIPSGGLGIQVKAVFGVSIPVVFRKGNLAATDSLSNPKILKIGEDTFLQVDVNRAGTKSILGTLKIYSDQQMIGLLKGVAVYLSTPKRIVQVKIGAEFANSISGKPLRVTFAPEAENEDAPNAEVTFTP